jgi:hypothetical protein
MNLKIVYIENPENGWRKREKRNHKREVLTVTELVRRYFVVELVGHY